jgi:hypothetical protein
MRTVHQYDMPTDYYAYGHHDPMVFKIPMGAAILGVHINPHLDLATLSAEVESDNAPEERAFVALPSGAEIKSHYRYINSVVDTGHVWHIFEIQNWSTRAE